MGSLAKCPTCKKDVSRAAKVCRTAHNYVFRPDWDSPRNILIFLVILFVIAVLSNGGSKTGINGIREDPDEPGHDPSSATCRSNWMKCTDNSDMAHHFIGWSDVRKACQLAANDLAQYGTPEWSWTPFSSFHDGTTYSTGIATAIDRKVKFSNASGAMVRSEVVCEYDLNTKKVKDVTILLG